MCRVPPSSTRTYTLLPSTTLFRSAADGGGQRLLFRAPAGRIFRRGADRARPVGGLRPAARGGPGNGGTLAAAQSGLNPGLMRSEEHTSEIQSLMRISYAVFC